jgi:Fe-S oxidoreductase
MQSPENAFFAKRIEAAVNAPLDVARRNRPWDGARAALRPIPGAEVRDIELSKNRTYCCGAGGGCLWKEKEASPGGAINQKRLDQIGEANPETLAGGCPCCMSMLEDALKLPSLEAVRDPSELIADSSGALDK